MSVAAKPPGSRRVTTMAPTASSSRKMGTANRLRIPSARGRECFGGAAIVGRMVEYPAIHTKHCGSSSIAKPQGTPHNGVEYRLDVGRGAGDNAQDLARRRLLFQGVA